MKIIEITIAGLLAVLVIIIYIYLTYFLYGDYKKRVERKLEDSLEEKYDDTKNKIVSIVLVGYLLISAFVFTTNVFYKTSPNINNQIYVSVNSDSMAMPLSSNKYLKENNLTNQIKQYDIAVINPLNDGEIKKYDVILFKHDNSLIIHRVINIEGDKYHTQGDANILEDEFVVMRNDVIGIYDHSLIFMSMINYLGYTPGFYVLIVGVTYCLATIIFFEIKNKKLFK